MKETINNALHNRFACKSYDSTRKVKDENFELILESAYLSPSSFGLEPWKVLVVEKDILIEQLRPYAWGAINSFNGASHFVIILARKNVTADSDYFRYISQDIKGARGNHFEAVKNTFNNFPKNEFKLGTDVTKINDWASKQTYIMLANMMYTASLLGIDSCPIEGFDIDKCNAVLKNHHIDIEAFTVSCMVSFGYHKGAITPKTRRSKTDVIKIIK